MCRWIELLGVLFDRRPIHLCARTGRQHSCTVYTVPCTLKCKRKGTCKGTVWHCRILFVPSSPPAKSINRTSSPVPSVCVIVQSPSLHFIQPQPRPRCTLQFKWTKQYSSYRTPGAPHLITSIAFLAPLTTQLVAPHMRIFAVLAFVVSTAAFEYVGIYPGNPSVNQPYQKGVTSGLLYQKRQSSSGLFRQFVLTAYRNGVKLNHSAVRKLKTVDYALLMFTGYDRTPDAMLGDTSGETDLRGELSNTKPLFTALSDNATVVILAMSNCATGVGGLEPCAANTTSIGRLSTCTHLDAVPIPF